MRIWRFEIHHVRLPLITPWITAYGLEESVESVLIKAFSDNAEAWVETCPLRLPLYTPETAGTVYHILTKLFSLQIAGKELENSDSISKLLKPFRGNRFAKAGMEQCWWGLESIRQALPLHRLIGGEDRPITAREAFGIEDSIELLLEKIDRAVCQGAERVKLKIRRGWDIDVIKSVRDTYPNLDLLVDGNGGYTLDDMPLFRSIDRLGLEMIEQPLGYRDLNDHTVLQRELDTVVCLDESITCSGDACQAVRLESCRAINIKIGRVGGLSDSIAIHDLCRNNGLSCNVGGMMESGIGTACNIELATLPNCSGFNGITLPLRFHSADTVLPPIVRSGKGALFPSTGPYIGRDVREEYIEEITIEKEVVEG